MNFNFNEDYVLENEVVRLQPLKISDYEKLVEYSINEPELWSFNSNGPDSPENLKTYISFAIDQREKKLEYPFIVFDKVTQKYIGSTRFYNMVLESKTLEIGFTWYGKEFQGTKVNKNCKYLLLEFAFEKMLLERVGFRANSLNNRSINAMKSIGCIEEGILRSFRPDAKGNRIDAIVLSILKNEWFESVKENLNFKINK
jgi:RimJ/RimL family protein N-acetyltransferase